LTHEVLARFDAEMRRDPPAGAGSRIERSGSVVRERGSHNLICSWDFSVDETERVVAGEAAFFRRLGEDVEWKVYAHDRPENLAAVLAANGFAAEERETVMVLDLGVRENEWPANSDIEVRLVKTAAELETYLAVTEQAFGSAAQSTAQSLAARALGVAPDTFAYVAYVAARPVAAGRLELPHGRAFASLWGGGTDPSFRGRGVYRRLVAERARWARTRGYAYLTVDAQQTSRPILERLGFTALTTVQGWTLAGRE
jgi:GNAT superfamily N-acetyltransferase